MMPRQAEGGGRRDKRLNLKIVAGAGILAGGRSGGTGT